RQRDRRRCRRPAPATRKNARAGEAAVSRCNLVEVVIGLVFGLHAASKIGGPVKIAGWWSRRRSYSLLERDQLAAAPRRTIGPYVAIAAHVSAAITPAQKERIVGAAFRSATRGAQLAAVLTGLMFLASCASVRAFPDDPEDSAATLAS